MLHVCCMYVCMFVCLYVYRNVFSILVFLKLLGILWCCDCVVNTAWMDKFPYMVSPRAPRCFVVNSMNGTKNKQHCNAVCWRLFPKDPVSNTTNHITLHKNCYNQLVPILNAFPENVYNSHFRRNSWGYVSQIPIILNLWTQQTPQSGGLGDYWALCFRFLQKWNWIPLLRGLQMKVISF